MVPNGSSRRGPERELGAGHGGSWHSGTGTLRPGLSRHWGWGRTTGAAWHRRRAMGTSFPPIMPTGPLLRRGGFKDTVSQALHHRRTPPLACLWTVPVCEWLVTRGLCQTLAGPCPCLRCHTSASVAYHLCLSLSRVRAPVRCGKPRSPRGRQATVATDRSFLPEVQVRSQQDQP